MPVNCGIVDKTVNGLKRLASCNIFLKIRSV